MTPKEKAKELIKSFSEPTKVPNVKGVWVDDLSGAKHCAITCVQEVLQVLSYFVEENAYRDDITKSYWQKVKQEIISYKMES